jgi:hypothetical protein
VFGHLVLSFISSYCMWLWGRCAHGVDMLLGSRKDEGRRKASSRLHFCGPRMVDFDSWQQFRSVAFRGHLLSLPNYYE